MFNTPVFNSDHIGGETFDWEAYFSDEFAHNIIEKMDLNYILSKAREHLKENKFRLAFTLNKMMKKLLKGKEPSNPRILELGAATGFLTRWFIEQFGGTGVLVDYSQASYQAYTDLEDHIKQNITYINIDIFQLDLDERFDLVCSFGLIEHFKDKKAIINAHRKFVAPGGMIIILIPMDTPLSRTFSELHPELNLGYRELLKEKEFVDILIQQGLKVLRIETSFGYSYDFVGAICI